MAKCRRCGKQIAYIMTFSGNRLAVNPEEVYYRAKKDGPNKIVTPNGEVLKCVLLDGDTDDLTHATGYGYRPHNPLCTGADYNRKDRG